MPPNAELADLARAAQRQLGAFTTADVLSSGLDRAFLSSMAGCGEWTELHPTVWRAASTPLSVELRESAALLWLGGASALSHLSAARRYGLSVPRSASIWVTVPTSVKPRPQPNVVVTRSGVPFTRTNVNGLPCVDSARAIADLAQCSDYATVKSALLASVQRRLVTPERVAEACRRLGNRPGNGSLRRLLGHFDQALESWLEDRWAAGLCRLGIAGWVPQLIIAGGDGRPVARADFGDEQARLAVQLDGFAYHSTVEQLRRDKAIDRAAARLGYQTLRFDADDVTNRLDASIREVEAIRSARLGRPAA